MKADRIGRSVVETIIQEKAHLQISVALPHGLAYSSNLQAPAKNIDRGTVQNLNAIKVAYIPSLKILTLNDIC